MKAQLKEVTATPGSSLKVKVFEEKAFEPLWHFHPQYELTYMIQSTGIRYVGDSMETFESGDLVLVGKNLPHSWKTIDSKSENVKCVIVQWDESLLKDWLHKPEFIGVKQLLKQSFRGVSFDYHTARALEPLFLKLSYQDSLEKLITFLQILNILTTKAKTTLLAGQGFEKNLSSKESHRVNLINSYIRDNIHNSHSLEELSGLLSISKEAFCRFFKKTFDKTFSSYLNEYKVAIASKLLIETDLSVSEVGYSSGFNNLSFFHRQFQKHMGMSPSKYRKAYRRIPIASV